MKLGKVIKLIGCFCAVTILLVGCNNSSKEEKDDASVKELTKIVVGIPQDIDSLDPHLSNATGTQEIMYNVFTGLFSPSSGGELVPEIAQNYTVNDDMTSYKFKLNQGIKFHDGSDLTSADVKYSLDRLCGNTGDQDKPLSSSYANVIDNVVAEDDYTVIVNLKQTDVAFLSKMTIAIIPENSGASQAENPVGAGPYKFKSYTPGVSIVLEKNKDYYISNQPHIDVAEFKIFSDMNTAVLSLSNGEINLMNITEDIIPQIPADRFTIVDYPMNTVQILGLNNDFQAFKNKKVREAINYAIDKDEIISMISPNAAKLGSNFSPVMSLYYQDGLENMYKTDTEKAKSLLKEADYENLKFTCKVASEYKLNVDAAQIIKQQLSKAGIDMQIEIIDWSTWLDDVYTNRNHEATIVGFTGKLDPDGILKRYVSDYSKNFINYNNTEYDNLISSAAKEVDNDKRIAYYKEAQKVLADDASSVFIMDPSNHVVVDNKIEGYVSYPINFIDLRTLKFK